MRAAFRHYAAIALTAAAAYAAAAINITLTFLPFFATLTPLWCCFLFIYFMLSPDAIFADCHIFIMLRRRHYFSCWFRDADWLRWARLRHDSNSTESLTPSFPSPISLLPPNSAPPPPFRACFMPMSADAAPLFYTPFIFDVTFILRAFATCCRQRRAYCLPFSRAVMP